MAKKNKMQFNQSSNMPAYNTAALEQYKYSRFYNQCKEMKKSKDKETALKGKALQNAYKLFQKMGVPFDVVTIIFPQLCVQFSEYIDELSKLKEGTKNVG